MSAPIERGGNPFIPGYLRLGPSNNQLLLVLRGDGAPSGSTGAGIAGTGSLYCNVANGHYYVNQGTMASPSWSALGGGGGGSASNANFYFGGSKMVAPARSTTYALIPDWKTCVVNSSAFDVDATFVWTTHSRTTDAGTSVRCALSVISGVSALTLVENTAVTATETDYSGTNQIQSMDITSHLSGSNETLGVLSKGSNANADYFAQSWIDVYVP